MRLIRYISFLLFYIKEVIKSNIVVATIVLGSTKNLKPGFLKIDLEPMTDFQLVVFTNLLTMTPGSMVISVAENREYMYVHILTVDDPDAVKQDIIDNYLKRVKQVF